MICSLLKFHAFNNLHDVFAHFWFKKINELPFWWPLCKISKYKIILKILIWMFFTHDLCLHICIVKVFAFYLSFNMSIKLLNVIIQWETTVSLSMTMKYLLMRSILHFIEILRQTFKVTYEGMAVIYFKNRSEQHWKIFFV